LIHSSILLIAKLTGIELPVGMKNMAEHRNRPLKQKTIDIFGRYTENYAYLCFRKQGFFEMAEAKSGWIPLCFHHRIDAKKGNG